MTPAGVVERMPIPMGVVAETGATYPRLSDASVRHLGGVDPEPVLARSRRTRAIAADGSVDDPMNLSETGWGVVFASDADAAVREALKPLLEWRQQQVNDDKLFKVFEGSSGVKPTQTAASWLAAKNVSIAPVSPRRGVPYYLLIVGSPQRIPFEFQALLDLQWAVGRLHFDAVEDYASYAQHVVDYERKATAARQRRVALWMPRNAGDLATPLLAGAIGTDFLGEGGSPALGKKRGFSIASFIGDGQATKARLTDIFRGTIDGGAPALVFTGSHGAEWAIAAPDVQRQRQGALVTQEWERGRPLQPEHYFAADDLPANADVRGLVAFIFACFGGGCPDTDSYSLGPNGTRIPLTPEPIVARLPQALLARGALAVIAHVDRAFSYGFEDVMGTPQEQLLRSPLELLMKGQRAGMAVDPLNLQWSTLAAQLGQVLGNVPGQPQAASAIVANLYVARDDAKNYVVLGDPAVRMRVEEGG